MKKIEGGIYYIKFKDVDRFYIGSTTNFSRRKSQHLYLLRRNEHTNPKLQNYFNKYGEKSFKFIKIERFKEVKADEMEWLFDLEQSYLDKYHAQEFEKTAGEDDRFDKALLNCGPIVNKEMYIWDDDRRKSLIERNKNFEWTEERRKRMSEIKKGTILSKESKKKQSDSLKKFYEDQVNDGRDNCPKCGNHRPNKVGKRKKKSTGEYGQRYKCGDCGKNFTRYKD